MTRPAGLLLFAGIVVYTVFSLIKARKQAAQAEDFGLDELTGKKPASTWINLGYIVVGLVLLVSGSHLLVQGAVKLALGLGVSQAVVGLTIVAFGTSLPDLATSVVAAMKKEADLAVGNVVGSNIFNILAILGVASLVRPVRALGVGWTDLGVMLFVALLALPLMRTGYRLSRLEGVLLLLVYGGYLTWLIV
ncbi:MAG: hypothetical protein AB1896_00895 [Thermodesulfobacteriota bacterium]